MFKLIMMYTLLFNGPVNVAQVSGEFATQQECENFGKVMAFDLRNNKMFVKGSGRFFCEEVVK